MKRLLKALIVENSEDDAQLMLRELERGGFEVTYRRVETAAAFQDALHHEKWDVLLCDYGRSQFGGPDALHIIKESGLDLPFIFFSGALEETGTEAMSHDLQEPLRAMSGYAQLLQRRLSDTVEVVDANAALQQALVQLFSAIAEASAEIKADPLPSLRFSKAPLVQVFQNLIGNALKYRDSAPPNIQVNAYRQGEAWVFRVADNGIGFEAQYAERIFEAFKRLHTREAYAGTGVGLALVRRIVELRGGGNLGRIEPGSWVDVFLFRA